MAVEDAKVLVPHSGVHTHRSSLENVSDTIFFHIRHSHGVLYGQLSALEDRIIADPVCDVVDFTLCLVERSPPHMLWTEGFSGLCLHVDLKGPGR